MDASAAMFGLGLLSLVTSAVTAWFSARAWVLSRRTELRLKVHMVTLSALAIKGADGSPAASHKSAARFVLIHRLRRDMRA